MVEFGDRTKTDCSPQGLSRLDWAKGLTIGSFLLSLAGCSDRKLGPTLLEASVENQICLDLPNGDVLPLSGSVSLPEGIEVDSLCAELTVGSASFTIPLELSPTGRFELTKLADGHPFPVGVYDVMFKAKLPGGWEIIGADSIGVFNKDRFHPSPPNITTSDNSTFTIGPIPPILGKPPKEIIGFVAENRAADGQSPEYKAHFFEIKQGEDLGSATYSLPSAFSKGGSVTGAAMTYGDGHILPICTLPHYMSQSSFSPLLNPTISSTDPFGSGGADLSQFSFNRSK